MNLEKAVLFGFFGTIGACGLILALYLGGVVDTNEIVEVEPQDVLISSTTNESEDLFEPPEVIIEKKETEAAIETEIFDDTNVNIITDLEDLLESYDFEGEEAAGNKRLNPLVLEDSSEKYYVAKGERCFMIRYTCDEGWNLFNDDIGCGCEKLIETVITENPNVQTDDYPTIVSEWGQNLNPEDVVPANAWQAFYFSVTEPTEVVRTETVDRLSVNFNWTDMDIEPEEFAAYWVGDWEFAEETVWAINLAQGWSKARIIIDDQLVYAGDSSVEVLYTFTPGTHRIEVEYLNAWHTVEFSVNFGQPVERLSNERLPAWIELNNLDSLPLGLVSVYESNSFDTRIPIEFVDENEPILLLLSSYSAVEWNLEPLPAWVQGVVVASYESATRAVGVPDSVPLVYLNDYLDLPYRLQPECGSFGGYSHCEHTGLVGIDTVIEPIFETTPTYFSGAYNTPGLTMPDLSISDDLRKNITTSYKTWKDEQRKAADKTAEFDGLFD